MEAEAEATYYEIVAYPRGDLCERVGVAGRDEDDVCPAPELDVQYRISDAVAWLRVRRRRRRRGEGEKGRVRVIVSASCTRSTGQWQGRTSHSSSSVQTSTPCLRMSSGWKNVRDGLVAATCTDTSLCYKTAPSTRSQGATRDDTEWAWKEGGR